MPKPQAVFRALLAMTAIALVATFTVRETVWEQPWQYDTPQENPHPGPLGVYVGAGNTTRVEKFETWLGKDINYVLDFVGRSPRSDKRPWAGIEDPTARCSPWADSDYQLVLSVAMLPNERFTLGKGAEGAYDLHWHSFGRTMVAAGCEDAIVRLGWEFNGRFFPWAAGGLEAEYASYWRRIVSILRSVPGQRFRFDWSILAGNTGAQVEAAYPGDDVVDFIGLDAYDTSEFEDQEARWKDQMDRTYGLTWHVEFAERHNKPMTIPEWGLSVRSEDDLGGGDSPSYVNNMIRWISSHNVAYSLYFDFDAKDAAHRISSERFPVASKVFLDKAGTLAKSGSGSGDRPQ